MPLSWKEREARHAKATARRTALEVGTTAAERSFLEEPYVEVSLPDPIENWHLPSETSSMRLRRKPRFAAALLCAWLCSLLLGQLATTLLWLWMLIPIESRDALLSGRVLIRPLFRATLWTIALVGLASLPILFPRLRPRWLHIYPVASTVVSLTLTGLPVLNVYSAAALFAPQHETGSDCGCWEVLEVPTFIVLAIMYLADALPPVLKAEYGDGDNIDRAIKTLNGIYWFARAACAVAAGLYTIAYLLYRMTDAGPWVICWWKRHPEGCSASGPLTNRGLVLGCHAIGLICGEMYCRTLDVYNEDVHRLFFKAGQQVVRALPVPSKAPSGANSSPPAIRDTGAVSSGSVTTVAVARQSAPASQNQVYTKVVQMAQWFDEEIKQLSTASCEAPTESRVCRARKLTKWTGRLYNLAEEMVPTLRQAAPPTYVVAFLVALRRAAPILAPVIVLLAQLQRTGIDPRIGLLLGQSVFALLVWEAQKQHPKIPESRLQRLALMVPNFYIDPSTRWKLGYSLSTVKQARKARKGIKKLLRLPVDALQYGVNILTWPFQYVASGVSQ